MRSLPLCVAAACLAVACKAPAASRGAAAADSTAAFYEVPDSVVTLAEWLLPAGAGPQRPDDMRYGARLIRSAASRYMLRLDTLVAHEADGRAVWSNRRVFVVGVLGDTVTMTMSCGPAGREPDGRTVAVVRLPAAESLTVVRAWRIRVREFVVEPVSRDSVTCVTEGWDS